MKKMFYQLAESTAADYVCAACWNHLIIAVDQELAILGIQDRYYMVCPLCGEVEYFHSKNYAQWQQNQAAHQAAVASYTLKDYLPQNQKRNEKDILRDLGF